MLNVDKSKTCINQKKINFNALYEKTLQIVENQNLEFMVC